MDRYSIHFFWLWLWTPRTQLMRCSYFSTCVITGHVRFSDKLYVNVKPPLLSADYSIWLLLCQHGDLVDNSYCLLPWTRCCRYLCYWIFPCTKPGKNTEYFLWTALYFLTLFWSSPWVNAYQKGRIFTYHWWVAKTQIKPPLALPFLFSSDS